MKPVLIVQHDNHDTPDHFAVFLREREIPFTVTRVDRQEVVPVSPRNYSGIALLGGAMSANDHEHLSFLNDEMNLLQQAYAAQIPCIGHCLGGQIMAKSMGATIQAAPQTEIGWCEINVRTADTANEWFGGRRQFTVLQWHGESFAIPQRADWLAESAYCPHQAFSFDQRHLAMQFHCEALAPKIDRWVNEMGEEISRCGHLDSVQSAATLLLQTPERLKESIRIANDIYTRWVQMLSPV